MHKTEADISLIRKYLNGELDARAMHRLERRAMDDPFLMDALEGYENAKVGQQPQLAELSSRLQHRVARKEARVIPFRFIAVAASVLIVASVGGWLLLNTHKQAQLPKVASVIPSSDTTGSKAPAMGVDVAKTELQKAPITQKQLPPPVTSKIITEIKPATAQQYGNAAPAEVVADDEIVAKPGLVMADTMIAANANKEATPLDEMIVMDYTSQKKKVNIGKDSLKKSRAFNLPQLVTAKVPGVSTTPANNRFNDLNPIAGLVVTRPDGLPIAGAQVHVAGSNKTAYTNAKGIFTLPVDSSKVKLNVGYVGYQSQQYNVGSRQDTIKIALQPDPASLSEVVVANYDKKIPGANLTTAHPKDGWYSFNEYLKTHAISPDGKTGTVHLSFTVSTLGVISDIKVTKGLSDLTDKKAIDLLKTGPAWFGNINGKAEQMEVKVKFK